MKKILTIALLLFASPLHAQITGGAGGGGGGSTYTADETTLHLSGTAFSIKSTQGAALNMGSNKITSVTDPTAAQDAATKNYVDTSTSTKVLPTKIPARLGTAAALPANSYSNGSSGVGATLTGLALGQITIDGTIPNVGDRVLVNNEAAAANNGLYLVTVNGAGLLYQLTRVVDFDSVSEMGAGEAVVVTSGAVNADNFYVLIASVTTVGTSAINFSQANAQFLGGRVPNATTFASSVTFAQDVQAPGSTVTFNAGQTVNWQTAGPNVSITLTGNITSFTWSNMATRGYYTLALTQDGTGSRTVVWPTSPAPIWPNKGTAPTLTTTAGGRDYFLIYFDIDGQPHILAEALNN